MIIIGYVLPFMIGLIIAINIPVLPAIVVSIIISWLLGKRINEAGLGGLLIANMLAVYWIGYIVGIIWRWINDPQNLGILDFIKDLFTPNTF